MNNWVIGGRVGGDAEHRYTSGGESVVNFSVAIDNGKDSNGQARKPTWVRVTMWGKRWENLAKYILKGKFVVVSGRATLGRPYETRENVTRQDLILTAFDFSFGGGGEQQRQTQEISEPETPQSTGDTTAEISDEDIPF